MLGAVSVKLHAIGIILGEQRVIAADPLDELAVPRLARVRHHDLVVRPLLCATARQPNCYWH